MKLKTLTSAIIVAALPSTAVFAAALDRSGQSVSAFLQPGNYFEAGISIIDPNVSGQSNDGKATGDMANDYYFPAAALKIQATDKLSVGLLYDQPFGADAEYSTINPNFSANGQGTSAEVRTQNLTALIGYQPTERWNIYGGAAYQTAEGKVALRGDAYSVLSGYNATLSEDDGWGWVAGVAYQIPEIALKASLTYRSAIEHELDGYETHSGYPLNVALSSALNTTIPAFKPGKTTIETPQSVNLDFQTGIMANTVAFANIRWAEWSDFSIRPNEFGQALDLLANSNPALKGGNLVDYSDDQWSATVGVGRKFNEKWAGNTSIGWDSGAGDPVTTLGPVEGYWNVGLGLQYSPAENYFIGGGVKYFMFGDATAKTVSNPNVGKFDDNDGWAYGLKMGYRF